MSPSTRQQRQALRRQRRQQHQLHRKGARRREVSPHLSRRVRSSDLHSLDERQRHMAQAILSHRNQAQRLQALSHQNLDDAAPIELPNPSQGETALEISLAMEPTALTDSHDPEQTVEPMPEQ